MNKVKVPQQVFRSATAEKAGDTLKVSISSDTPYLRYDYWNDQEYYEVLDHSPGGYEDGRLKAGLPILFNHQRNNHMGRALDAECDGKRLTVSNFKRSETGEAPDRWRDVDNGSLADTSVGYALLDKGKEIGKKDGIPILRFRWEPQEFSFVTIPADYSVGAGRQRDKAPEGTPKEISIETENNVDASLRNENNESQNRENSQESETDMKRRNFRFEADNGANASTGTATRQETKIDVVKERETAITEFKARCGKIDAFVAALKNEAWRATAAEVAAKHKAGEANFDEFRTEALNSFTKEAVAIDTEVNGVQRMVGLNEKEKQRFSLMRAIRTLAAKQPLSGLEKEVSDAAAANSKMQARVDAIYLPPDINEYDLRSHPGFNQRDYERYLRSVNVTSGTAGGFTVATQMGSMIELLRNMTVLNKVGVTTISGLHGDLSFPQQTGGATAYWVGEEECVTDSAPTFAQKNLTPHRLSASIPFTSQFLAQSSLSVEQFLRNELQTVAGLAIDKAGLEGTGSGGEPLGVKYTPNVGADITFGGAAEWADMVAFETYVATANAQIGSMAFIVSAATRGKWKTKLKDSVAGAGYLIANNETNGYPVYATNQITGDIVFFGVWSQLIHAMWDTQEIIVDPYALKKCGGIEITYNSFHDFLVRQPKAFEVSTDTGAA